jgi:hypothetical protein
MLMIDRDSHLSIKETRYKIFTGPTQGTVKVQRDPEARPQQKEGATTSPASTKSVSGGEQAAIPTPSGTRIA